MQLRKDAREKIKARRKQSLIRYFFYFVSLLIVVSALSPLQLSNPYLRASSFETVTVQRQENVWSIASRYSQDSRQIRRLAAAIIEINSLSADAGVKAGQELRVPVLRPADDGLARLAEK